MSKKWTIVTVNYKTEAYLPWKLKMIYENENKDNFHYVIIDNSPVHNKAFFDDLKLQYPDIKVIPFVPKDVGRTSGEHGEGLNVEGLAGLVRQAGPTGQEACPTRYPIVQDSAPTLYLIRGRSTPSPD